MAQPARRDRRAQCERLALMVLSVSLAAAGLTARPDSGTPAPAAVVRRAPAVSAAGVGAPRWPAPVRPPRVEREPVAADETPGDLVAEGGAAGAGVVPEAAGPVVDEPAAPDIVVSLDWPPAASPWWWTPEVHAHGAAAAPPAEPAMVVMDTVAGSGDGMQGLEPGARYWFGPDGLVKLTAITEGQQ